MNGPEFENPTVSWYEFYVAQKECRRSCRGWFWSSTSELGSSRAVVALDPIKPGTTAFVDKAGVAQYVHDNTDAVLLVNTSSLFAEGQGGSLTTGDAALLRFTAATEILDDRLPGEYNQLAGIQDSEGPTGSGNPAFTKALTVLDSDILNQEKVLGSLSKLDFCPTGLKLNFCQSGLEGKNPD